MFQTIRTGVMSTFAMTALTMMTMFSCGQVDSGNGNELFIVTRLSMDPLPLKKQESDCASLFSAEDEASFLISQFIDGARVYKEHDFSSQLIDNYVQSPGAAPISSLIYGYSATQRRTVRFNSRTGDIEVRQRENFLSVQNHGEKLDVCPTQSIYKEFTYEEAALNISNAITKTYTKLSALNLEIEPIKVRVAPRIFKDSRLIDENGNTQKLIGYEVDNAYYNPRSKTVTFLPQSETYRDASGSPPFWQMPSVGSHEYGHHVFSMITGDKMRKSKVLSRGCFLGHDTVDKLLEEGSKRANDASFAVRAINEGFSDLIALYTLDDGESSTKNIACFDKTREAGSAKTKSGKNKVFSETGLELINSAVKVKSLAKSCNDINYQEIHKVGAVFSHGFDFVLGEMGADKEMKLKVLVQWLKVLSETHGSLKDSLAGEYLFSASELYLKTAQEIMKLEDNSAGCFALATIFPSKKSKLCEVSSNPLL